MNLRCKLFGHSFTHVRSRRKNPKADYEFFSMIYECSRCGRISMSTVKLFDTGNFEWVENNL